MANENLIPTHTKFSKLSPENHRGAARFGGGYQPKAVPDYYTSKFVHKNGLWYSLHAEVKKKFFGGEYLEIQLIRHEDLRKKHDLIFESKVDLKKYSVFTIKDIHVEVNKFLKDHFIQNDIEV